MFNNQIFTTMKYLFWFCCLVMVSSSAFAQKKYLVLHNKSINDYWAICGDIPGGMKEIYRTDGGEVEIHNVVANIFDELSEKGYEVEFMPDKYNYLLSKKSSDSYSEIRRVQIDNDDITEIARYNLQGIPIKENEKGVQIIVYSNYTTKTVIVQ